MGYNIANLKNRGLLLAALAAAALIGGCGGTSSGAPLTDAGPDVQTAAAPSMAELEAVLRAELERLQVDTSREAAAAPTAGSAVFDLAAQVTITDEAEVDTFVQSVGRGQQILMPFQFGKP